MKPEKIAELNKNNPIQKYLEKQFESFLNKDSIILVSPTPVHYPKEGILSYGWWVSDKKNSKKVSREFYISVDELIADGIL